MLRPVVQQPSHTYLPPKQVASFAHVAAPPELGWPGGPVELRVWLKAFEHCCSLATSHTAACGTGATVGTKVAPDVGPSVGSPDGVAVGTSDGAGVASRQPIDHSPFGNPAVA